MKHSANRSSKENKYTLNSASYTSACVSKAKRFRSVLHTVVSEMYQSASRVLKKEVNFFCVRRFSPKFAISEALCKCVEEGKYLLAKLSSILEVTTPFLHFCMTSIEDVSMDTLVSLR